MPQPHNFDPNIDDRNTTGVMIALITFTFIFAVSLWDEFLR
jgi:hypothetical protein